MKTKLLKLAVAGAAVTFALGACNSNQKSTTSSDSITSDTSVMTDSLNTMGTGSGTDSTSMGAGTLGETGSGTGTGGSGTTNGSGTNGGGNGSSSGSGAGTGSTTRP